MGSTSTSSALFLTFLLIASFSVEISAKRGCSAFGHSCYGGHGKRSYSESVDLDLARNKEGTQQNDYDLSRSNAESVALVPSQGYNRQEQRSIHSIHERPNTNSWSLFIRKLLVPYRRPYMAYSESQK
ncbi:neuropeptide CCHamide-2 [Nasonia vitripennis]|uniref:Uncharacterized protein n=1 Tax=Nasonia vitripennis TaxID=7425 RepID=A0A7M7T867_NASVI|nr:neuropeptide CCHamide-2 [Nasonia vitripennis]